MKKQEVKPKFPIEYRLLMRQTYDEREQAIVTQVGIRTINDFQNFLYEIVVTAELNDRVIKLHIHGLRAPQVTIPGTGPAKFKTSFRDLRGLYTVIISKLNKEENQYEVEITEKAVVVAKSPKKKFIDLVTNEESW